MARWRAVSIVPERPPRSSRRYDSEKVCAICVRAAVPAAIEPVCPPLPLVRAERVERPAPRARRVDVERDGGKERTARGAVGRHRRLRERPRLACRRIVAEHEVDHVGKPRARARPRLGGVARERRRDRRRCRRGGSGRRRLRRRRHGPERRGTRRRGRGAVDTRRAHAAMPSANVTQHVRTASDAETTVHRPRKPRHYTRHPPCCPIGLLASVALPRARLQLSNRANRWGRPQRSERAGSGSANRCNHERAQRVDGSAAVAAKRETASGRW